MAVVPNQDAKEHFTSALSDRYRIEREIGAGGMATVYLAKDLKHDRQVAVKVLNPELAEALGADRFLSEIKVTANLSHPHILPLFDSGEADGFLYYVMPFLEGESLQARLDREKQLPVEDAVQITRQVADALAFAHTKGVIHRDVKPGNILLEAGHAVLADFGIARAAAEADGTRLTGSGVALGTPAYMSPEQTTGDQEVDGRSDQYALGCVLYEMLTGIPPFSGATAESVVRQHMVADPMPVTQARPSVPREMVEALRKALSKAPADRFKTTSEFGAALTAAPTTTGTLAAPRTTERTRRLAAVWFADIVGYSSLTAEDEDAALEVVDELQSLAREAVEAHQGRIVKFVGDAVLTVFESMDAALRAALALQEAFSSSEVAQQHNCAIRIGVHLGEVVEAADGDVYGNGVNTASRLDAAAEPGQVVVSEAVYQQIRHRSQFEVYPLGVKTLKGLNEPLAVFAVAKAGKGVVPTGTKTTFRTRTGRPAALTRNRAIWIAAAVVVFGAYFVSQLLDAPADEPIALAPFAAPDVDRPTIAVLPLANLSADEENSYFAAGIHEELLRLLSLVRSLGVISRTSVLQYAGVDKNIREIAAELGARYIVEGSVQEDQGRVRIQVQLIDATTDQHLWAERYDRSLDDIFQLQSEVAGAIARALEAVVTPGEQEQMEAPPTQDPLAYDLYLRSAEYSSRGYSSSKENYDARIELLRQATRLDPDFALAHASLAHVLGEGRLQHGYPPPDSALARAERALALDPHLPKAHAAKGWLLTYMGQPEAARASLQRAVTLDPSMAYAWTGLSIVGHISGDFVAGALAARRGLQADRSYSTAALHLGFSLMGAGMYDEAALWYPESATWWGLFGLLWNAVSAGDLAAAQGHAGRMLEQYPDNLLALYNAAAFEALFGNPENAETILGQVADLAPELTINGSSTPEGLLAWIQGQSGQPEGRERLERLRLLRMEQVEQDETSLHFFGDLFLIATVLGDDDERLRIAAAIQRLDQNGTWYLLRDSKINDSIRDHPEFQAWLQDAEERKAAQRRELVLLGPWTPEGLLRTGNRSPGGD